MAKVENLFNSNGELFYPLTHVKAVVNDSGENVEQLLEAQNEKIGDWENSGNDSILDEIGEHYAEEGDSDYDKGLWGQMRDTRGRLSTLEQNVVEKSHISQETGDSENVVMSQKAVSEKIGELESEMPMKLEICTTSGYINFNKEQSIATLSANVTMRINGTDVTIPSGEYPYEPSIANQYFVYRESTASASFINKDIVKTTDHVIMVIRTVSDVLRQIVSSSIPYRVDGKSLETRVESLETNIKNLGVSNDAEFNSLVKELYIPSLTIDLNSITLIRFYNGYAGLYGLKFYIDSSPVLSITTDSKKTIITHNISHAVIADYPEEEYKDYHVNIKEIVRNLDLMPIIKEYINNAKAGTRLTELESEMPMKLEICTTSGYINFNKEQSIATLSANVTMRINGTDVTIPSGEYPYEPSIANQYFVYRESTASASFINKDIVKTTDHVIMVIRTVSDVLRQIVSSSIPYRVDGKSLETRVESLETKVLLLSGDSFFDKLLLSPNKSHPNYPRPLFYEGDTNEDTNFVMNAVAYPNGVIIAARAGLGVVRINLDGSEEILLPLTGATDWRCLWMDSQKNVFASPHATAVTGEAMPMTARGLYKLAYGESSFIKVISLYNIDSSVPSETEENDDTIWTMCEDNEGNLYAGVYSHSKRYNPAIYKSEDGGNTWSYHYNFIDSGLAVSGHHVHSIIYNEYDNALYAIIGEINTIYKSTDGASTWENLNAGCEYDKGSAMMATPTGILIGSDGAYNCAVAKYYPNGTVKTRGVVSANTIFAFRKSDVTNRIYAFCKIDSSVTVDYYFPPIGAIEDESLIDSWDGTNKASWEKYNAITKILYPDDAIKPQHYMILMTDDDGETWSVVYREFAGAYGASGFWTAGQFRNGECLGGRIVREASGTLKPIRPIIISEGVHKYTDEGCSIEGTLYSRINKSKVVEPL